MKMVWICRLTCVTIKALLETSQQSVINLLRHNFNKEILTDVMIFPDRMITCRKFLEAELQGQKSEGCTESNCKFGHEKTSLSRLITHIKSARKTIDICVFTISCQELAETVINMHKRGVIVRVITDNEQMELNCSQAERFRREGIQVRHDSSSFFMHHKFVIIDSRILINGSFNWTRQAISGNRENVMVLNIPEVVAPYIKEFQNLWDEYCPHKRQNIKEVESLQKIKQ